MTKATSRYKFIKFCLVGCLLLSLLLVACGDGSRPTRPAQLDLVAPTFPPLIDTLPPAAPPAIMASTPRPASNGQPTADSAPLPTASDFYPATPLPTFVIFVSPPPLATFEAQRISGDRGRPATAQNLKVENLTKVNGVPLVPYIPFAQSKQPPLPPRAANYGPNNRPRVGIQVGHLGTPQLPDEWASMRGQTGGSGGGRTEVEVDYDIARRAAVMLQSRGIVVDILTATVPPGYTADAFVALHCDAVTSSGPNGFKLARNEDSAIPKTDDALVGALYAQYETATGMRRDGSITPAMTGYYAFSGSYKQYAISKITPAAILEMGFITSPIDQQILFNRADDVARGVANGIIVFLNGRPPLEQREVPPATAPAIEALQTATPVYDAANGGSIIAYVTKQQVFLDYTALNDSYRIWVPVLDKQGFIRKDDARLISIPR